MSGGKLKSFFSTLGNSLSRYIDFRMAVIGSFLMGSAVWIVNIPHGPLGAATAALKQATYTLFFAGLIMKACERLASRDGDPRASLAMSVTIPSMMAIGFTYLVHSLRGTPEPFFSTIPTMVLAPPSFFWWGRRTQGGTKKER